MAAVARVHHLIRTEERAHGRAVGDAFSTSLQQLQVSQRMRQFAINALPFPALVEYLALVVTHDEAMVDALHAALVLASPPPATLYEAFAEPPAWDASTENLYTSACRLRM